jgi:hypothetical protein
MAPRSQGHHIDAFFNAETLKAELESRYPDDPPDDSGQLLEHGGIPILVY